MQHAAWFQFYVKDALTQSKSTLADAQNKNTLVHT